MDTRVRVAKERGGVGKREQRGEERRGAEVSTNGITWNQKAPHPSGSPAHLLCTAADGYIMHSFRRAFWELLKHLQSSESVPQRAAVTSTLS